MPFLFTAVSSAVVASCEQKFDKAHLVQLSTGPGEEFLQQRLRAGLLYRLGQLASLAECSRFSADQSVTYDRT